MQKCPQTKKLAKVLVNNYGLFVQKLFGVKAIGNFRNRIFFSHRFTNNLQGLQKVMVKDFSWNIIPWNAFKGYFLRKH